MNQISMLTRYFYRFIAVLLTVSASTLAWSQSNEPLLKGDFIVAIVGAQAVTNHEVRMAAAQLQDDQLIRDGKKAPISALLVAALEKVINEKALLDYAIEAKVEVDALEIDQAEQRLAAQRQISVEQLRKTKIAQGISLQEFRQQLKNQLLTQKLTDRSVVARIKLTDQEIDAAMQAYAKPTTEPNVEVELAQIFLTIPESASSDQIKQIEKKAQSLLDQIKRGADFGDLARANSDGAERANGGSMGLRALNRYPELFVQNASQLTVGATSSIIRSPAGLHILKLLDKRSSNQIQLTETHARHILLRLGNGMNVLTAKALIANYRSEIVANKASFAELAKAHSQDGSAAQGGDLGWVAPSTFVPEFEDVMDKLAINEISDPVVSRFGVHLIQVLERRPITVSEREFREMIRNQLRAQKYDATYQDWVKEIRGQTYVEYIDTPR